MLIKLYRLFFMGSFWLAAAMAHAEVSPPFLRVTQIEQSDASIGVTIGISGLSDASGDVVAPSLSGYDFDVLFDPGHLAYVGTHFGDNLLGNQLDLLSFGANLADSSLNAAGVLNVYELSLDTVDDLNNLQATDFDLLTISFDIVSHGSSQLAFTLNSMVDAEGNALSVLAFDKTITTVPLPSAFFMMLPGLASLGFAGRRKISP